MKASVREQQSVAWEAVNKYGIIELFLDEDNAKEWAEQEGRVMPLSYTHIAASERIVRLEQALEWVLGAYVDVCLTNTSESWDAEEEQDVIDARRLLSGE